MAEMKEEKKEQFGAAFAESKQDVAGVAEKAKERSKQRVQPYISDRKEQLVEQLNRTAGALHQTGSQLTDQRSGDLIRMSAEKIEQLGTYLGTRDIDQLMDDLRDFARARPWAVMGGAFFIGLAAARFMKAGGRPTAES